MAELRVASQHPVTRQHPGLLLTHPNVTSQPAPLFLTGYLGMSLFLVYHPSDEENQCSQLVPFGQTAAWSHRPSSQCGQSPPQVLADHTGVFFFIGSNPGYEETPMWSAITPWPACTLIWSLPIPMWPVSTLGVSCYMGEFFFLGSNCGDEETPCGQPAPCGCNSILVSSLLIALWPVRAINVNWLHRGALLCCESPWWWRNYMGPSSYFWLDSTLISLPYSSQCAQSTPCF